MQAQIALKHADRRALAITPSREPQHASQTILRQIESEAQAVAVSMQGMKLAFVAASLGRSETYLCRIRSGQRPMPDWMVAPFCRVTNTLLVQQYRDLQAALAEITQQRTAAETIARLAAQLREVA